MITSPIFTTDKTAEMITPAVARDYIEKHDKYEMPRLTMLDNYYCGRQHICDRRKSDDMLCNNRVMINHAAYIAKFTSSYLIATPVSYRGKDDTDITAITDCLNYADSSTQDADLALDAAIFGRAYELIYMDVDSRPKLARITPLSAFVVYDDTVEQNPVFAVYYYPVFEPGNSTPKCFKCQLMTDTIMQDFELTSNFGIKSEGEIIPHYFGKVPLNEIYNDGQQQGDFEQVISLIDAYNILQSDRVNDKEQFVDSLMYIKGQILGETDDEKAETYGDIQRNRVVELSQDGEIGFLTRQFDEASVEVLRKSIVTDIHKISGVPDMSDDNFAGNASGVAMKYKLLNLEQITKTKERFFTEGLRYRLECLSNIIGIKGGYIDPKQIDITFTRSLPQNELELSQVVATLDGKVPQETLLSQLPFVKDPQSAAEELRQQKQDAIAAQQQMFMNTPLVRGDKGEKSE